MSEENGGSAENTAVEGDFSTEGVDSQLAEMRQAEQAEAREVREQKKEKETETLEQVSPETRPEVKEEEPAARKVVPLEALHEERRARQELAKQNQQLAQQQAVLAQRLEELRNPPQRIPEFNEDPGSHLLHQVHNLRQQQEQIAQQNYRYEQERQQQVAIAELSQKVIQASQEFSKTTPDFEKAIEFVRNQRAQELMAYGASEAEAMQQAHNDVARDALIQASKGSDPAKTFYAIAKARGYNPVQVQLPAEKLEAERKGVAASRTLGSGGVQAGKLTLESLAAMSDEDFSKVKDSDWRRAMGG